MIRFARTLLALTVALAGTCFIPSNATTIMFPKVTGQNLNGKTFNLPDDFRSPASLVYLAYVRGQQSQVDTWKPFVADARRRYPAIGEYEVPTLPKENALVRRFINSGMRHGISDNATREATITLYIDKAPFDDALGITSENEITVLLVKPDGTVLWRATGAYDESKTGGLEASLQALET